MPAAGTATARKRSAVKPQLAQPAPAIGRARMQPRARGIAPVPVIDRRAMAPRAPGRKPVSELARAVSAVTGSGETMRPESELVDVRGALVRGELAAIRDAAGFDEEEVRGHLPLVRQVVQRMLPRKPPDVATEDLMSWGVVGLLDAIKKYDATREASFPTYAQYRIRGTILDYLRRCDWLPRSVRERSHDIERVTRSLETQLGRAPEPEEIAAELEMPLEDFTQAVASAGAPAVVPLRDLCFGRGEEALSAEDVLDDGEDQGPLAKQLRKERVEMLARAIERLPEKERIVVTFYYFEGLTMREMAIALRLTEGRISQLHSQAMARLRGSLQRITGEDHFC